MDKTGKRARQMAFRLGKRRFPFRADNIHDGFRLRQLKTAVQKSPFGKFAAHGGNCAAAQSKGQCFPKRLRRAVDLDFHHVFSRVGMRGFHVHRKTFVNPLFAVRHMAEIHHARHSFFKGFNCSRMKYFIRDLRRGNAAQTDDADSPFTGRGSDGGNRCLFVHTLLLHEIKGIFSIVPYIPLCIENDRHRIVR